MSSQPSFRRSVLFAAIAAFLGLVILEGVLWIFDVAPLSQEEDPYVGFSDRVPLFVEESPGHFVTAANRLRFFNRQAFELPKPRGTQRVFCLGGSTTHGRPYDHRTAFCEWLGQFLQETRPEETWETINVGGISYASYRVALIFEEVLRYDPDLLVLYTGHNEFLEARTYAPILEVSPGLRALGSLAARSRAASLVARGLEALTAPGETNDSSASGDATSDRTTLETEVSTRLDASVGPDDFVRDDAFARGALEHFRHNLERMAELAEDSHTPLVLVTPASNVRDMSPFKSSPTREDAGAEEIWRNRRAESTEALQSGDSARAIADLEEATADDPRNADAWFRLGRALEHAGRGEEAADAFLRARDEDVCPLRAPSAFENAVREVAASRDLPLVDFARWCARRSPGGAPGGELFLDHVHPTVEAHRDLALLILERLGEAGVISAAPEPGEEVIAGVSGRISGSITPEDRSRALTNLSKVLGWAGRLEEAHGAARRAAELDPGNADAWYHAALTAQLSGSHQTAVELYVRTLELGARTALVHGNLAAALEELGHLEAATLNYRRAVELAPGDPQRRKNLVEVLHATAEARARDGSVEGAEAARAEAALFSDDAALRPDSSHLRVLGIGRLRVGDAAGAAPLLQAALAAAPGSDETRHALVSALEATRRSHEARRLLEGAIREDQGDEAAHRLILGSLLFRKGRLREAAREFETVMALRPEAVEAASNLAWILATADDNGLRNPESALRWGQHAVERAPRDPYALDALAAAEASAGHPDRAAALAAEALRRLGSADPETAKAISQRLAEYRSALSEASH